MLAAHLLGLGRRLKIALWVWFALTATATAHFGWHYVLDDLAGIATSRGSRWAPWPSAWPGCSAGSPSERCAAAGWPPRSATYRPGTSARVTGATCRCPPRGRAPVGR
ncbi:MAG: phosphatase PAP2 family protein, partial [Thermoleophilaceae bacterium]|nr:phosphatase PAP2 family protein [Thermoleophilaceae bacterium]